jgi:thiol-disulfide isomerase/thioredoxin
MISYPRGRNRGAAGATLHVCLASLMACLCLVGVAIAQPSTSMQFRDASGNPIGGRRQTVLVNVSGTVMDADTHEPLPSFYVTPGAQDRERTGFDWFETNRVLFDRGKFTMTFAKDRLPPAVLIEADGYLPQRSDFIRGLETNLTFMLKKGKGPTGVVLTPDGHPAAGRTVYFSRLKDLIFLEGPTLTAKKASSRGRSTVTDDAGGFSFAPDLDGFSIVIADDLGFANVRVDDLKSSPGIRLQPWAKVEGTLKIGAQLAANETVRMADAFAPFAYYPRPMPPFAISAEVTTDSSGHFVFPRVPPGDVKIFHSPKVGSPAAGLVPTTQITNLTLKAGETRTLTLGGQGRPIIGRVVLKNSATPVNWQEQVFWIDSLSPEPTDCPNFDAIGQEYRKAAAVARTQADMDAAQTRYLAEHDRIARQLCAYYSSPEGRRYWFSKRLYVLEFSPDGSFRIHDVPGGKYELTIDLRDLVNNRGQARSPLLALHRQEVEVPEAPGGRSDTPLDLGLIDMLAQLSPGDIAPDFAVPTLDNKTVKLSDYKGKYVLVNFWAMTNAPSAAEMSDLKETYAAFKNDPRFAMIGLDLDANIESARDFSVTNQFDWIQGWLGNGSDRDLPDRYGIEKLPFATLVGPDGRVLASGLPVGTIKSTVDMVLAGPQ